MVGLRASRVEIRYLVLAESKAPEDRDSGRKLEEPGNSLGGLAFEDSILRLLGVV